MPLSLFESSPAPLQIIKEFVPHDGKIVRSAGTLSIRANNYGSASVLTPFGQFYDMLTADAQRCEPPLTITRAMIKVVRHAGEVCGSTYGLAVDIPEGHVVPDDYIRLKKTEHIR